MDVNQETKEITFAHISGSGFGMNLTTMSTETRLITKDDKGVMPEVDALENAYLRKIIEEKLEMKKWMMKVV